MERDFDKVCAYSYGWLLYTTETGYAEYASILVSATPGARIRVVDGVQYISFNALTIASGSYNCETLDEYQDYMLELIRNTPDWTHNHKDALYAEGYANAWVDAIQYLAELYPENTPQFKLLLKYANIVRNSGLPVI